jgi:hypothetical protein
VPRITTVCICIYVFGCRLSLFRLCDSVIIIIIIIIIIAIITIIRILNLQAERVTSMGET